MPACADPIRPTEPADPGPEGQPVQFTARTRLALDGQRFRLNGALTYHGEPPEGMLLNVRMVNSVFEDDGRPDFDPEKNTANTSAGCRTTSLGECVRSPYRFRAATPGTAALATLHFGRMARSTRPTSRAWLA